MKNKLKLTALILIVGVNCFGQRSKITRGLLNGSTYTLKYDTIQIYFNEITGVSEGKLITQWVKGFMIKQSFYENARTIGNYNEYYIYSDKKTKVTNKIIQSY